MTTLTLILLDSALPGFEHLLTRNIKVQRRVRDSRLRENDSRVPLPALINFSGRAHRVRVCLPYCAATAAHVCTKRLSEGVAGCCIRLCSQRARSTSPIPLLRGGYSRSPGRGSGAGGRPGDPQRAGIQGVAAARLRVGSRVQSREAPEI